MLVARAGGSCGRGPPSPSTPATLGSESMVANPWPLTRSPSPLSHPSDPLPLKLIGAGWSGVAEGGIVLIWRGVTGEPETLQTTVTPFYFSLPTERSGGITHGRCLAQNAVVE